MQYTGLVELPSAVIHKFSDVKDVGHYAKATATFLWQAAQSALGCQAGRTLPLHFLPHRQTGKTDEGSLFVDATRIGDFERCAPLEGPEIPVIGVRAERNLPSASAWRMAVRSRSSRL